MMAFRKSSIFSLTYFFSLPILEWTMSIFGRDVPDKVAVLFPRRWPDSIKKRSQVVLFRRIDWIIKGFNFPSQKDETYARLRTFHNCGLNFLFEIAPCVIDQSIRPLCMISLSPLSHLLNQPTILECSTGNCLWAILNQNDLLWFPLYLGSLSHGVQRVSQNQRWS